MTQARKLAEYEACRKPSIFIQIMKTMNKMTIMNRGTQVMMVKVMKMKKLAVEKRYPDLTDSHIVTCVIWHSIILC